MEWRDQGALLAVRRHGETAAIIEVFTALHGRHAGVVRGGASRRVVPVLQPGAQLDVTWRARLESIPTGLTIPDADVDALVQYGEKLVREHPAIRAVAAAAGENPVAGAPPVTARARPPAR